MSLIHSLHSQGWSRLSHVDAAIPNRSARLTLPLVHLSCSLHLGLPQSGVISLDALALLGTARRKVGFRAFCYKCESAFSANALQWLILDSSLSGPPTLMRMKTSFFKT